MPLQLRRGTDLQRQSMTEPLAAGELIYVTDTGELYIGDGTTAGGNPIAQYTTATIKNLAAGVLTGGAHSGITFTYDSVSGTIDAVVDPDLSNYQGVIRASAFNGTLVADDSTVLVDAVDGKIELDGTVKGDIVPSLDQIYDLGSASNRFKDIYLSGSSIFLGNATITATGTFVNLPAGSTVNGVPIGTGTGTGDGVIEGSTYKINIAGDDSTIIVNATTEVVTAQGGFIGNLTGNVIGNVTGNVNGNLTGNVIGDVTGNVTGNVTGDLDGTVIGFLVGDSFGNLTGNVTGNLTGNVTGNVTGDLLGNVTGDLKGSVFGADSSVLIDATESKILGDVDNFSVTTEDFVGKRIVLEGTTGLGNKAGIRINTDGNSNDSYDLFTIEGWKSDPDAFSLVFGRSRGTQSSPAALQAGDEITSFVFFGADANASLYPAAAMLVGVNDTPGANIVPGFLSLATSDATGNLVPGLTIDEQQVIDVAANTVTAGVGSGEADISSVATYLKIKIGGVEYAIPAYSINP